MIARLLKTYIGILCMSYDLFLLRSMESRSHYPHLPNEENESLSITCSSHTTVRYQGRDSDIELCITNAVNVLFTLKFSSLNPTI